MASEPIKPAEKIVWTLPHEEIEFQRLDKQHTAFTLVFDGLYPCKDVVKKVLDPSNGEPKRILDLGSGSGTWAIEMAKEFPHAEVLGLDLVPRKAENVPSNCSFQAWNLNDGLSQYHSSFDLVHARLVDYGIEDHSAFMLDAERCMKPGGFIIMMAIGSGLVTEERNVIYPPLTSNNREGSWYQRFLAILHVGSKSRGFKPEPTRNDYNRGLWHHDLCDKDSCGAAHVTIPAGPWARSPISEEDARLREVGELWRDNFLALHYNHNKTLALAGRTPKDIEVLHQNIEEELRSGQKRIGTRFKVIWGRTASGKTTQPAQEDVFQTTHSNNSTGFQMVEYFKDPDEWWNFANQIDSTANSDMISLQGVAGFDMLESW